MTSAIAAIGIIGFFVWAHHMFTVGMDIDTRAYFTAATGIISLPTSVKVFSYLLTSTTSRPVMSASMIAYWAFLISFTLGGFTGLVLSSGALDVLLHDTYFVVGHFHTVLSLGAVFGIFVAFFFNYDLFTGSTVNDGYSIVVVLNILLAVNLIFLPMHSLGIYGMARRIPEYADVFYALISLGTVGFILVIVSIISLTRSNVSNITSSSLTLLL